MGSGGGFHPGRRTAARRRRALLPAPGRGSGAGGTLQ